MSNIYHIEEIKKRIYYNEALKLPAVLGSLLGTVAANALSIEPCIYGSIPFLSFYYLLYLNNYIQTRKITKTQEVITLQAAYDVILEEIIKLYKTYDFKTPLDAYSLYTYLYHTNKLNLTSSTDSIKRETIWEKGFQGAISLNDHGVCRHIARMFIDINKKLGFPSTFSICTQIGRDIHEIPIILTGEQLKQLYEEMQQNLRDNLPIELPTSEEMLKDSSIIAFHIHEEEIIPPKKELQKGNHAVTIVNDDAHSYYLDAYNQNIYVKDPNEEGYMIDETGSRIYVKTKLNNYYLRTHDQIKIPELPLRTHESMAEEIYASAQVITSNEDIANAFYARIEEPLQEAENAIQLIYKK